MTDDSIQERPPATTHGVAVAPASALKALADAVLMAAGLAAGDAAEVSAALLSADLRGTASHGLVRLPFLVARLRDGGALADARPAIVSQTPAIAVVDGGRALGPITSAFAMRLAIEKATALGVGVVSVRNSDFFGTCAHPALMAADADMIGLVWTNGHPGMAPWGGASHAIGNNPLGIAAPRATGRPIVLDMAMSVSAGGRVRLHAERGEAIPGDWIVDSQGRPTTDARVFLSGGALLSHGHKGFGLAVMGEILAGLLAGAAMLSDVPAWFKDTASPIGNGHLHIALNVAAFTDLASFKQRVDEMADRIKATPRRPGVDEILMPGERGGRTELRQGIAGVAMPADVLAQLVALGREFGVPQTILDPIWRLIS